MEKRASVREEARRGHALSPGLRGTREARVAPSGAAPATLKRVAFTFRVIARRAFMEKNHASKPNAPSQPCVRLVAAVAASGPSWASPLVSKDVATKP